MRLFIYNFALNGNGPVDLMISIYFPIRSFMKCRKTKNKLCKQSLKGV